jgi:uncharacterized membrane protein YbhN (UPF0104 family)
MPAQDPPAGIGSITTSGSARPKGNWLGRAAWIVLVAVLLYWALRNAPLAQIWMALGSLRLWQAGALLLLNLFIYLLVTARWWLIVRAGGRRIAFLPLVGVRMSVFGISYFTLGPQVGGEPLQVLYLERKYGMPYTHATATVILDKLLEFLANFVLLAVGLTAVVREGIMSGNAGAATGLLIWLAALALLPPAYLLLLFNKMHPLSGLARLLPPARRGARPVRFLHAAEHLAGRFCRRYPAALIASICASLLAAIGVVSEYALMTSFLQIHLPFWQIAAAWTAGWLAFLVPLPGGLGALEASQVFALGAFGVPAASAIGVTLLIRGRDILIGGFGLLLAGGGLRRRETTRSKGEQP